MMSFANRGLVKVLLGAGLFLAGIAVGTWQTRRVEAQNRFGQPKTVIHVVVYKWKNTVSQDDKDQALNGIKAMAAKIPGIKNIWLKTIRVQPQDFNAVFAIEFVNQDAADDYRDHPAHQAWEKQYLGIRENSLSGQATN